MPLILLKAGEHSIITRIGGRAETRRFLEGLGFVVGTPVSVVSVIGGNVICAIRDSRIAISEEMAGSVFV